jgi:hypothetical protein
LRHSHFNGRRKPAPAMPPVTKSAGSISRSRPGSFRVCQGHRALLEKRRRNGKNRPHEFYLFACRLTLSAILL